MNQFVLIKDLSIFMKHFYPPEDWENRINPGFYKWNYCDFTAVTKFIRETCEIRIYSDLIPEKQCHMNYMMEQEYILMNQQKMILIVRIVCFTFDS